GQREEFDQVLVHRARRRLQEEDVAVPDRLIDPDREFAIREPLDLDAPQRPARLSRDRVGQAAARRPRQDRAPVHASPVRPLLGPDGRARLRARPGPRRRPHVRRSAVASRFHVSTHSERRVWTAWCTVPGGNAPSGRPSPASSPVTIGHPSSTRSIAWIWKRPASTASRTSRRSIRFSMILLGITTPYSPEHSTLML